MPQRTLWMHGANMQVEYPNRITSVRATGPFVRIEGARGQNTWLHFPVPTPAVIDGTRMRIEGALVSFRTRDNASVNEIIVYDGDQRIVEHMDQDLRGEHPEYRVEVPGNPEINRGINIVLGVAFRQRRSGRALHADRNHRRGLGIHWIGLYSFHGT